MNAYLQKQISRLHAVNVSLSTGYDDFDIIYSGSSYYNTTMSNTRLNGVFGYNGKFPFGMNIYGEAGASWLKTVTNGKGVHKLSPYAQVSMSYSPGRQHQINFTGQYVLISMTEAKKTGNIIQSNEMLYITGNPDLKPCNEMSLNLNYVWLPSNNLYAVAFAQYIHDFKPDIQIYSHYDDGKALLRSYINDGHSSVTTVGLQATYKPLAALQLEGTVAYRNYSVSGLIDKSIHPVEGRVAATYYLGKFYIGASGSWDSRMFNSDSGQVKYIPWTYALKGGYSNKGWTVQAVARNIFSSDWVSSTAELTSPLYSVYNTNYGEGDHRKLTIAVSYTFDYGKRINHGDEIGEGSGGKSAVLK